MKAAVGPAEGEEKGKRMGKQTRGGTKKGCMRGRSSEEDDGMTSWKEGGQKGLVIDGLEIQFGERRNVRMKGGETTGKDMVKK